MDGVGKPDQLKQSLGLAGEVSEDIAAIVVFAAQVEFYLERAIWRLRKEVPTGEYPTTDRVPISRLIRTLRDEATNAADSAVRSLLEAWCSAADPAFICRHTVVHGALAPIGGVFSLSRNPAWAGERRKREFTNIWSSGGELSAVRDAFAVLLRIIAAAAQNDETLRRYANAEALQALKIAAGVTGEFVSSHSPEFEKY